MLVRRQSTEENAFLAMARLADRHDWCWRIGCTTCGCHQFRVGFHELARGVHPGSEEWRLTRGPAEFEGTSEQLLRFTETEQGAIAGIVSQVSLVDLDASCRWPEWVGYLGLALAFTEECERESGILTRSLVPQFTALVSPQERERLFKRLRHGEERLRWEDLAMISHAIGENRTAV